MTNNKTPDEKTQQPDQPSQSPQSLSGFGALDGIDDAKNIHVRNKTTLELLIGISDEIVKKYSKEIDDSYTYDFNKMDILYTRLYLNLLQRTAEIEINEQDIASFVTSKANHELVEEEATVLGIYSGCLAQILTERNALQGKRTTIHLDGHGNKFDYLFYYARILDTVIIENFSGDKILAYAGNFGGKADTLFCRGIKGKNLLFSCGSSHGRVNRAIAIDVTESDNALSHCADYSGQVLQAIGININGNFTLSQCADDNGYVDQIIGVGLKGNNVLLDICSKSEDNGGKVHQILAVDIEGNTPLKMLNTNDDGIDQIIYDNVSKYLITPCKELIDGKTVRENYTEVQAERIERAIELVRSLKNKPYQDVIKIADEIYALRYICGRYFTEGVEK